MHLYFLSGPRQEFGSLGIIIAGKTRISFCLTLSAEFLIWNLLGN